MLFTCAKIYTHTLSLARFFFHPRRRHDCLRQISPFFILFANKPSSFLSRWINREEGLGKKIKILEEYSVWLFGSHFGPSSGSPGFESDCHTTSSDKVYPDLGIPRWRHDCLRLFSPFFIVFANKPSSFLSRWINREEEEGLSQGENIIGVLFRHFFFSIQDYEMVA